MFWSAAVVLTVALAWSWLSSVATYAQDDDAGDVPTIEDEPFVYWKCWRTGTHLGYGFTNNKQVEFVGGTWATPYLPDLSALRDAGYLVADSGTAGGRWQQTRASLMDGRFYRSPALRDGSFKPVKPSDSYGYFPFVGDGGTYNASGGFQVEDPRTDLTDAEREERNRSPLPDWNPYVAVADRRIDKIEITWDTHSGSAGAGSIDEVARSQQEQVADTETAEHLAYRQGPYRGPASVSGGTLDHYATVSESNSLGSAHPSVGYRAESGIVESQVMVVSGTSYTSTSGGTASTTYNISSQPRNVTNEVSGTSRNSPQHPEVNMAQVTVQEAELELKQIGHTDYFDDSRVPDLDEHDATIAFLSGDTFRQPAGYEFATRDRNGIRVKACFLAEDSSSIYDASFERYSRQYVAYCWMHRAGAVPSTVAGSERDVSPPSSGDLNGFVPSSTAPPGFPAEYAYMLEGGATMKDMPRYQRSPEPDGDEGILEANTPGERRGALTPKEADDAPNDALIVAIDLHSKYRKDPWTDYNLVDGSGDKRYRWKLFGDDRLTPRYHDAGAGLTRVGYNQSYLVPTFLGGRRNETFRRAEKAVPFLYDHEGKAEAYGLESLFVWPVRLDEMNYYLFRVPGFTHQHLGERGHIYNLSHAHSSGVSTDGVNVQFLGMTAEVTQQPAGQAVAIPAEVAGTSGRTDLGFTAETINPFADGKLYYPFYDHDIYKRTVEGNYGGKATDGYAPGSGGVLLNRSMLLKAGVASPQDRGAGPDSYDRNRTFRFQIDEGVPAGLAEDGTREDLLERLGFSVDYLATLKTSDGRPADPFADAWPNSRIDPDDTHLLVVTFYEGRIAGDWELQKAVDLPGLGQRVAPEFFTDARNKVGLGNDLGKVPRFQYRRVMCRVLVPAEGVVTPASGWEGLKDEVADVATDVVGAIAGWVGKLIAWFEDIPVQIVSGAARMAAGGVCEGAGVMESFGDDVPTDRGSDGTVRGADVSLSRVELNSQMGEERCDQIVDTAKGSGSSCGAVGNAVGDPTCSGVPAVNFRAWRLLDSGSYSSLGEAGRDDRYAGRWIPRGKTDYREDVDLVPNVPEGTAVTSEALARRSVDLRDSVGTDLGVGAARLEFQYDYMDLLYDRTANVSGTFPSERHDWPGANSAKTDYTDFLQRRPSSRFDGYILYVRPDPKTGWYFDAADTEYGGKTLPEYLEDIEKLEANKSGRPVSVGAVGPTEYRFVLPLYYLQFGSSDATGKVRVRRVKGFDLGPVNAHLDDGDCTYTQVPVVSTWNNAIGDKRAGISRINADGDSYGGNFGCQTSDDDLWSIGSNQKVAFVGPSHWALLEGYLNRLWYLGAGFEHQLALSAYRGTPGIDDGWTEGPRSDWVTISGGANIACRDPYVLRSSMVSDQDPNRHSYFPANDTGYDSSKHEGNPEAYDYYRSVFDRYGCRDLLSEGGIMSRFGPGSAYYQAVRDKYNADAQAMGINRLEPWAGQGRGVLGAQVTPDLAGFYDSTTLLGSRVCGNFWNGTPPSKTWDSPVTRALWHISWVLAMVLLFALLLRDGLALSYQGILGDGRGAGSVSLRTMLPRYALALILAASSLLICRVALTLASDVTCYVSQATGMTFWGVLGSLLGGVLAFAWRIVEGGWFVFLGASVLGVGSFVLMTFLVVLLFLMLVVLWYALKVFLGMVARILLLLILCGLSPVAMAMYASPSTEHWTKKWTSMFLGAAFQQVVVLMILFGGAALSFELVALLEGGYSAWFDAFIMMLMVLFTLFFAARAPDIINPGGKGLFSGLGQALIMAGSAALIAGGAIVGGIGGAFAGIGSGAQGGLGSAGQRTAAGIMGAADPGGAPGGAGGRTPGTGGGVTGALTGLSGNNAMGGQSGGGGSGSGGAGSSGGGVSGSTPSAPASGSGGAAAASPAGEPEAPRTTSAVGEGGQAGQAGEAPPGSPVSESTPGEGPGGRPPTPSEQIAGWFDRVRRGAQYGAARGQRGARYLETYGRGHFGSSPDRAYSRTAPVDVQSFRNFVNRNPMTSGDQARIESRQAEAGRGRFGFGLGYRRGYPDGTDTNEEFHS